MKPQHYSERVVVVDGWPVNVASYELDGKWHAKADNISPGATLSRFVAATREEAEQKVLDRARDLLSRTKRREV
jgi:hypothetical protein